MARFRANPSTGSGQASQEERHTHRFLSSHSFQITGGGGLVSPQLRASSDHCFIVGALRALLTLPAARGRDQAASDCACPASTPSSLALNQWIISARRASTGGCLVPAPTLLPPPSHPAPPAA